MSLATEFDRTKYLDWVGSFYGPNVRSDVGQQLCNVSTHSAANTVLNDVLRAHYSDHINAVDELASRCCAAPPLKRI